MQSSGQKSIQRTQPLQRSLSIWMLPFNDASLAPRSVYLAGTTANESPAHESIVHNSALSGPLLKPRARSQEIAAPC